MFWVWLPEHQAHFPTLNRYFLFVKVANLSVVQCHQVVCTIGKFPALTGVDLELEQGDKLLLSGPNGAGKTTLLRALAGLLKANRGEISVFGVDPAKQMADLAPLVGYVGHETHCWDDLSVADNLGLVGRLRRLEPQQVEDRVGELSQRFGLTDRLNVLHRDLSSGQKKRLALAVGLLHEPDLLLLDEPHASLDDQGRQLVNQQLKQTEATIVLATHELDEAAEVANRSARIVAGRIAELGESK